MGVVVVKRGLGLLVLFTVAALIGGNASAAFASATVEQVSITFTVDPFPVDDTCAGLGVVGILTGTETLTGQVVETDTGFHFEGADTFVYRVDFSDGSYLLASQRQNLSFNEHPLAGHVTFGSTLLEMGTLYDANGTVIGHEMFNARNRTTIVDGTAVVEFDTGFLTCR
jgi:hypothetical protein